MPFSRKLELVCVGGGGDKRYPHFGLRGCEAWRTSFQALCLAQAQRAGVGRGNPHGVYSVPIIICIRFSHRD